LGAASTFAVLSFDILVNAGLSELTGDIGTATTMVGFPPGIYTGTKYIGSAALSALTAGRNVYNQIVAMSGYTPLGENLAGQSLGPGVYQFSHGAILAAGGVLTLVGTGSSTDTWIFQIGGSLLATAGSTIALSNGAQACNVYWQVGLDATFDAGSVFQGHVLAYEQVTADADAVIHGSLFCLYGTVTLDAVEVD
ncbi:hypothetical protein NA56DRAFT_537481, partial [Hyaloscypha hepaticicola]